MIHSVSVCVAACVRKADSRLPMVPWAVSQKNWVRHCAYMERWLCESMKPGMSTPSSRWISLRRCGGANARSSSSVPTARIFPSLMQTASAVGFPSSIVSISGQEISVHSFASITISFLNQMRRGGRAARGREGPYHPTGLVRRYGRRYHCFCPTSFRANMAAMPMTVIAP